MTLAAALGVGEREMVALVGGGGKTSLLLHLADEVAMASTVVVTTTTKLGIDQTAGRDVCWSEHEAANALRHDPPGPVFLLAGREGEKVSGPAPERVDELFRSGVADYVLVEADGARRRPLKAPAAHEPVVPSAASLVVVVVGIDAVGATYQTAAHRPADAVRLAGADVDDAITVQAVAAVVTSPAGGLKGAPDTARIAVAITKVDEGTRQDAEELRVRVAQSDRIDRVLLVPRSGGIDRTDPRVLDPGHLPTPFSAEQIRHGCPTGREIRLSVVEGETEFVRVIRFVAVDARGALQESQAYGPHGKPLGEPVSSRHSWEEYQRHASFPASSATVKTEACSLPLGSITCRVYEIEEGDVATSFWFDLDRPGMPVKVVARVNGETVSSMTMIADSVR